MGQKIHTKTSGVGISNSTYIVPQINPSTGQVYKMTNEEYHAMMTSFASLSGTAWDGSNKSKTLSSNTALTLTTSRNNGIIEIIQDATGGRTLSINGVSIAINSGANSVTLVGFIKGVSGAIRVFVELNPISLTGGGGDTTAPTVVSADAIDTTHIQIVFSESVVATTAGWSFKKNGSALAITSVSGSGTTWTFVVAAMAGGDTILRSYNSATGNTEDGSANELVSFTDQSVSNSIGIIGLNPPTSFDAVVSGANVNMTWVDTNSSPNELGYEIIRNSSNTTVGGTLIHTSAANATSYTDTAPGTGTWYYFCRAKGNGTTSGHSTYVSDSVTISASYDTDAVAYFTAEGTISTTLKDAVNTAIVAMKAGTLWGKMKIVNFFVGTGLRNAKNPLNTDAAFRLTLNGASNPVLTDTGGWAFDGNDSFDTHLVPSTDLATGSEHFAIDIKNYSVTDKYLLGGTGTSGGHNYLGPQTPANITLRIQSGGDFNGGANASPNGLYICSIFNDGVAIRHRSEHSGTLFQNTDGAIGVDTPAASNATQYLGAFNNTAGGVPAGNATFNALSLCWGSGLTDAERVELRGILTTFRTNAGR